MGLRDCVLSETGQMGRIQKLKKKPADSCLKLILNACYYSKLYTIIEII